MAAPVTYLAVETADNTLKSNGQPETATYRMGLTTATPANVATVLANAGGLVAAIQGIILGRVVKQDFLYDSTIHEKIPATSKLAQRENKWLFRYHNPTSFKAFTVSIPCADLTKTMDNSEFVSLTTGAGLAVKTAFEQVVVCPDDQEEFGILDSIQFVGRNT